MTQNKNKKGIAKKALSISLVAAMLATSNVPVWASGFEAVEPAAEGFAVESAAPETEVTSPATEVSLQSEDVNLDNFKDESIKVAQNVAWGSEVTIEGNLTDKDGNQAAYYYEWRVDGNVVQSSNGEANSPLYTKSYTPTQQDYNKSLELRVYVLNDAGGRIYDRTFSAGIVAAQAIALPVPVLGKTTYTYTGKEQKVEPDNYTNETFSQSYTGLTKDYVDVVYSQKDENYTDADGTNKISVYYVINEKGKALGYTGVSSSVTYEITKKPLAADDFVLTLKNDSYEYTGNPISLTRDDIVLKEKATGIDVTASVKSVRSDNGVTVGDNYKAYIDSYAPANIDTTLEATKSVWDNYDLSKAITITSDNSYSIVERNFANATATLNQTYYTDVTPNDIIAHIKANPSLVSITSNGKTITLANLIKSGWDLKLSDAAVAALESETAGRINDGVTLFADTTNDSFTGEVSMDLVLAGGVFGNVSVGDDVLDTTKPATVDEANYKVPYIAKAYDLKEEGLKIVSYRGNTIIPASNYDITYEPDNTNAGIVKATIVGKDSYAGEQKVVYFAIQPDNVQASEVSTTDGDLTINYDNNADASLYADVFGLAIKTTLADKNTATLVEGTDYTVSYFYTDDPENSKLVTDTSVTADGENAVGNYVTAKITLTKGGNYNNNGITYVSKKLVEKSIENVTVIVNPDSYTYTGKAITPTVIVKDGSRYLYQDTDYTFETEQ